MFFMLEHSGTDSPPLDGLPSLMGNAPGRPEYFVGVKHAGSLGVVEH